MATTITPGPTPLTYNSYINNLSVLAVINIETVSGTTRAIDPNFNEIVPQMLNYAEMRIQRDLDLLPAQTSTEYLGLSGDSQLKIPVNEFVTVQNISVRRPGLTKLTPLIPTTKEFMLNVYPDPSEVGLPKFFAPFGSTDQGASDIVYLIAPPPDTNVFYDVVGTARLQTLNQYAGTPSADIGTTFISTFLPDLLLMASMIYISGYQRNFSATSDDPQMAVNYEKQYQTLLKGATVEEARRRWRASAWSSEASAPAATPART